MYDTSPFSFPPKGATKDFLPADIDPKALEALFDLDPSLETSFDLTEFVTGVPADTDSHGFVADTSPLGVLASSAVTSHSAEPLVTLTSTAADQQVTHFQQGITTTASTNTQQFLFQQKSPAAATTADSGVVGVPHQHPAPPLATAYQPALSPSLTVEEVSQALSDDCVFMPEYESLAVSSAAPTSTSLDNVWAQAPFYSTVKTEDLTLCSLEASLPGFTSTTTTTTTTSPVCKIECDEGVMGDDQFSPHGPRSRTLSESSGTTTSTMPDSPRRSSKGSSRRRQVPKGSEEYKEKRARNNIAVRKSRAKAKEKQRMTESHVKELVDKNDSLQKKVEMLTKELTVLKGLFVNVGANLPEDFAKIMEQHL